MGLGRESANKLEWGDAEEFETNKDKELQVDDSENEDVSEGIIHAPSSSHLIQPKEKSGRNWKAPAWLHDYVTGDQIEAGSDMIMFTTLDPVTFHEASKNKVWQKTMEQEMESIEKNQAWNLVELPPDAKMIGAKWVYKTKFDEHGNIDKYKAHLVAKGYAQEFGVDYNEVLA